MVARPERCGEAGSPRRRFWSADSVFSNTGPQGWPQRLTGCQVAKDRVGAALAARNSSSRDARIARTPARADPLAWHLSEQVADSQAKSEVPNHALSGTCHPTRLECPTSVANSSRTVLCEHHSSLTLSVRPRGWCSQSTLLGYRDGGLACRLATTRSEYCASRRRRYSQSLRTSLPNSAERSARTFRTSSSKGSDRDVSCDGSLTLFIPQQLRRHDLRRQQAEPQTDDPQVAVGCSASTIQLLL
jgi:hypothetical protein